MQKIPSTETHSELSSKFIIPNFLLFTTQRPSINQSKPSIMRVISFTLATIVATASMVIAAPAEASGAATKWICPNGWKYCGTCNGTSCKIAGINYSCNPNTSCIGDGGGDGQICGSNGLSDQICPVKK